MILYKDIKSYLKDELVQAKKVWIATAMISNEGWRFLQDNIPSNAQQNFLIGIDLATSPNVFESILTNMEINARVYQTTHTFHPKVYIVEKQNSDLIAFIGSSNTTMGGLENNVEMNFVVSDKEECRKLRQWFDELFVNGYLITDNFISDYKSKYKSSCALICEVSKNVATIKESIILDQKQFFCRNEHEIFNERYHRVNTESIYLLRMSVRDKFRNLHSKIYPKFSQYGLSDLHCHHNSREIVSRHFFNPFSGNYINAMWLHYGKSLEELQKYSDKEASFINNIRIQVIIHEDSLGIWLVLGKDWGSIKDREHFRRQMLNEQIQIDFFNHFKKLDNQYWISVPSFKSAAQITSHKQLMNIVCEETLSEYFIIGRDINYLDEKLSNEKIETTILEEFQKLYPLYEIMKHK